MRSLLVVIVFLSLVGSILFLDQYLTPEKELTVETPADFAPIFEEEKEALLETKEIVEDWPKEEETNLPEGALKIGFSASGLDDWQEKFFEGKSTYELIQDDDGEYVLDAKSSGTSSAVALKLKIPVEQNPVLHWQWRVLKFPDNKKYDEFNSKKDNDYAVRVYVLFRGITFLTPDIIQYVWDDHYEEGTYANSPYFRAVKTIVVQSDSTAPSEWVSETRNLNQDYEMLFGKKPKRWIQGVGIMSDSDNTETTAASQVKNVWFEL